jgi:hypothetical protein
MSKRQDQDVTMGALMVALQVHMSTLLAAVIGQQGTGNFYADRKRAGEPNYCVWRSQPLS